MRETELLSKNESLADADHADAEDHVVADLGGLAGTRVTTMHDLLAHGLEHGFRLLEGRRTAAGHEGERRALGAANTAGHRRIEGEHLRLRAEIVRGACTRDVDRRAVDKQRAGLRGAPRGGPRRAGGVPARTAELAGSVRTPANEGHRDRHGTTPNGSATRAST